MAVACGGAIGGGGAAGADCGWGENVVQKWESENEWGKEKGACTGFVFFSWTTNQRRICTKPYLFPHYYTINDDSCLNRY